MNRFTFLYKALSKRERIVGAVAILGVVIGLAGLSLAIFFRATVSAPAEGGTYREGIAGQPAYVNPVVARSPADKALVSLLFADLKDLSASIENAEQGRTVKLRLREGLLWSDGREITSDDVIFTIERIKDADTSSPLAAAWQGVSVERGSKLEMIFKLPVPYAFFEDTLSALRPLPKHLYAEIPPANWKLSDYNMRPVGSGPFVFTSRTSQTDGFISAYRLRANERAARKPYLDSLEILFYRNQEELIKAFNSGVIEGFFAPDPAMLSAVKRPYHSYRFSSPTYYAVFWNQSAVSALASEDVRQALSLSIDRAALTAKVLGENGAVSTDPFSPAFLSPLVSTSSPDKANELLDDAGWSRGEDGVRSKKVRTNTVRLEFTLTVPDVSYLTGAAEELASSWAKIGVRAKVEKMPLDAVIEGPIKNRTYEAMIFGNTLTRSGDPFSFWHSSGRLYPGLNLALYQSRTADSLITRLREEGDAEKRLSIMNELREEITDDEAALFLFSPSSTYATGKNLKGLSPELITDASDRFRNADKWYMETRRVWK